MRLLSGSASNSKVAALFQLKTPATEEERAFRPLSEVQRTGKLKVADRMSGQKP